MRFNLLPMALLIPLLGCQQSKNQELCESIYWRSYAQDVALRGQTMNEATLVKMCQKNQFTIPEKEWNEGFAVGVQTYCQNDFAMNLGKKGVSYPLNNCAKENQESLAKAHQLGVNSFCQGEAIQLKSSISQTPNQTPIPSHSETSSPLTNETKIESTSRSADQSQQPTQEPTQITKTTEAQTENPSENPTETQTQVQTQVQTQNQALNANLKAQVSGFQFGKTGELLTQECPPENTQFFHTGYIRGRIQFLIEKIERLNRIESPKDYSKITVPVPNLSPEEGDKVTASELNNLLKQFQDKADIKMTGDDRNQFIKQKEKALAELSELIHSQDWVL